MEVYRENYGPARLNREERWAHFEDPAEAKGFAMIPNVVLRAPSLSVTAKVAYALLKSYGWQDPYAFPGQRRMMKELNVGEHTLRAALRELEDTKLVDIKRRGQGNTNLYTFKSLEPSTLGSNTRTGAVPKTRTGADNEHTGDEYTEEEESGGKPRNALDLFCSLMELAGRQVTPETSRECGSR